MSILLEAVSSRTPLDLLLKSGRALICPIYKSTYERRDGPVPVPGKPPGVWRDHVLLWSKDLGRALDYLETRGDIDSAKLAYAGFSMGAGLAPAMLAVEKRFKTAILYSGGFYFRYELPDVHQLNFAPRVSVPVLMLNGHPPREEIREILDWLDKYLGPVQQN